MTEVTGIPSRKDDHIRINLEEDVQFRGLTTGLEHYRFAHTALPEINLSDVTTQVRLFNKTLHAPILISSMTGGTDRAGKINKTLATAAQAANIAMGLGSMRAAIQHPATAATFQVRDVAPDILLFANLHFERQSARTRRHQATDFDYGHMHSVSNFNFSWITP